MGTTYILGAGFSKAVFEKMPLMKELTSSVFRRLEGEKPINELKSKFGEDIELWLTYLSDDQPWLDETINLKNRALFLEISREIRNELIERQSEFIENYKTCLKPWFKKLIQHWHKNESTIISLNYDTLVEETAVNNHGSETSRALMYPVAFADIHSRSGAGMWGTGDKEFKTLTLCKLHGSLNWLYSGTKEYYGETIYLAKEAEKTISQQKGKISAMISDKIPLIIPPAANKSNSAFRHESIKTIWSIAKKALSESQNIYCLGYSLPKTDLMMKLFLNDNISSAAPVNFHVINSDNKNDLLNHYQQMVPAFYKLNLNYCGIENAVEKFVEETIVTE